MSRLNECRYFRYFFDASFNLIGVLYSFYDDYNDEYTG